MLQVRLRNKMNMSGALKTTLILLTIAWGTMVQGATWSISSNQNEINGLVLGVLPGDTILLQAGTWEYITFRDIHGTFHKPVIAINNGGVVIVNTQNNIYYKQGINIKGSHHFKLQGIGDQSKTYGIRVVNTNIGSGVDAREDVHHITMQNLEIRNPNFSGVMVKEDPRCDGRYARGTYVMTGIEIKNCYIHHTEGEGIYAGMTGYYGRLTACNGQPDTLLGVMLDSLVIANNIIKNTNREAIQVFSTYYSEVIGNVIDSFGTIGDINHSSGVSLGLGSGGVFAHNDIRNGFGHGINYAGEWHWLIYGNMIENSGMLRIHKAPNVLACGIYADAMYMASSHCLKIFNNTIINSKNNSIKLINPSAPSNHFVFIKNNILGKYGQGQRVYGKDDEEVFSFKFKYDIVIKGNYYTNNLNTIGFIDHRDGNYRLLPSSGLLNEGAQISHFYNVDIDGNNRVNEGIVDIGAYECQELKTGENIELKACTKTVFKNSPVLDGNEINYNPGDTFCLLGEKWSQIRIENFTGSADSPVVFKNIISKIIIDGTYYGLELTNNTNIKVEKCGTTDIGWDISNTTGNGVSLDRNTNIDISGISVSNSGNVAVIVKENVNTAGAANENIRIHDLTITQSGGKGIFNINRINGSVLSVNDFDKDVIINNCQIVSSGIPVFILNHEDLNLTIRNNTITCSSADVFDINKAHKANIYQNRIIVNNADLVDIEGKVRWLFHNNIITGTSASQFINSRNGSNRYKMASAKLYFVNNTIDVPNISTLWNANGSVWTTNNADFSNNAIIKRTNQAFLINNSNNAFYLNKGNVVIDSASASSYFTSPSTGDYTLFVNSPLVNSGISYSKDTFKVDFANAQRDNLRSFEIGAWSYAYVADAGGQSGSQGTSDDEKTVTSLNDQSKNTALNVFPNPSDGVINIEGIEVEKVVVYDLNGQKVYSQKGLNSVDLQHLSRGSYFLIISSPDGYFTTKIQISN